MFNKLLPTLVITISLSSCNLEGVKNKTEPNFFEVIDTSKIESVETINTESTIKKIVSDTLANGKKNE